MPQLPPLDMHAHVATDIPARDLEGLGAVVFVATRSVDEYSKTIPRSDRVTLWGVGCHPSLVGVQRAFDERAFEQAIQSTPFVSEIGLDGASRVPLDIQRSTLDAILRIVARSPRLTSIHSNQAQREVLDAVAMSDVRSGLALHWWLGSDEETREAIQLGAYFSVNYSMIRSGEVWKSIPLDRILTETDHPAGDRFSKQPRQPGHIRPVEDAIARVHGVSPFALRHQIWQNFSRLVADTEVRGRLPSVIQAMLRSV